MKWKNNIFSSYFSFKVINTKPTSVWLSTSTTGRSKRSAPTSPSLRGTATSVSPKASISKWRQPKPTSAVWRSTCSNTPPDTVRVRVVFVLVQIFFLFSSIYFLFNLFCFDCFFFSSSSSVGFLFLFRNLHASRSFKSFNTLYDFSNKTSHYLLRILNSQVSK